MKVEFGWMIMVLRGCCVMDGLNGIVMLKMH